MTHNYFLPTSRHDGWHRLDSLRQNFPRKHGGVYRLCRSWQSDRHRLHMQCRSSSSLWCLRRGDIPHHIRRYTTPPACVKTKNGVSQGLNNETLFGTIYNIRYKRNAWFEQQPLCRKDKFDCGGGTEGKYECTELYKNKHWITYYDAVFF